MYDVSREGVVFTTVERNIKEVYFTSPFRSGYSEVDSARAFLYEADKAKDAVVFVHGLGRRKISHVQFYPERLTRNGFTTIMPVLPFHYERVSSTHEFSNTFLKGPTEVMEHKFYQAVIDVFTCIDFLEKSGYARIHIIGISSGGMIATITMALDRRIERGILIITGGNLESISWKSIVTKLYRIKNRGNNKRNPKKSQKIHESLLDKYTRFFSSIEDLKKIPSFFRYDPSLFAKLIDPGRVLMFSAIIDPFIPRASSNDLWRRLGKPERYMLPSGHLTAQLFFRKFILKKSVDFLRS